MDDIWYSTTYLAGICIALAWHKTGLNNVHCPSAVRLWYYPALTSFDRSKANVHISTFNFRLSNIKRHLYMCTRRWRWCDGGGAQSECMLIRLPLALFFRIFSFDLWNVLLSTNVTAYACVPKCEKQHQVKKTHHVKVPTMHIFIHRVTLTPNVLNYKLDNANFFLREWMPNDKSGTVKVRSALQ